MLPPGVHLKENSWRARLACRIMKAYSVAIVFGNTIHLWNITTAEFMRNKRLVRHELKHVEQYQRLGYLRFLVQYLWESWRKGYYQNRFEVEARAAEMEVTGRN
jgi:hypothetical protein